MNGTAQRIVVGVVVGVLTMSSATVLFNSFRTAIQLARVIKEQQIIERDLQELKNGNPNRSR
jgi:hypothetical protein